MLSKIKIVHIDKTGSTQDAVVEYLKDDYYPSLLLVAKIQTKGRGRKDDDWVSPEGGFWATLGILTSLHFNNAQLALFHYFTAILLTRVIKEEHNTRVQIKWPNDLLYENKKLAGILIDYITSSQNNYLLIGMGVNLNNSSEEMPDVLKQITTSIKDIIKKEISLDNFAHQIASYANHYFSPIMENNQQKIQNLIEEYNQQSRIYRKEVILDDSKSYYCNGINQEGLMQFNGDKVNLNLSIDDLTRIKKIISR
ncbi:MAG: biotin--[acetyl-CoA-carboxylase] ligase [Promethearchaeota archaeon]|jgi:BirA family biotin operon repressor/biotin-[acetyl-CoA-carboxylase] ligase